MTTESGAGPLKREMGLFALTVYGVGGMLGGGIYALVGKVAGEAGMWSWASFLAAMLVAAPTALTYAALASRYPRSGGESVFVERAFGSEGVAFLVGWTVVFSGLVSMATLAHGFSGYLRELWPSLPDAAAIVGFVLLLSIINIRGIRLTSRANIVATIIEFSGLLLVVAAGLLVVTGGGLSGTAPPGAPATAQGGSPVLGILQGATLAFYAFIGFEDMVNVVEEVKRPRKHLPTAIVLALVSVGLTYVAVSVLATASVPPATLDEAAAPLHVVVRTGIPGFPDPVFTLVALFAVGNTALLNFVMASRLAYGMAADQELMPSWLGEVHEERRTPHRAVALVGILALTLALSGTLETLAATTSLLLLAVFFLMNLSYLVVRRRENRGPGRDDNRRDGGEPRAEDDDRQPFSVPVLVPVLGMALSVALAAFVSWQSMAAVAGVIGAGLLALGALKLRAS